MTEPPDVWLRRLFEFEYCPECGGDAQDHEVCLVLGNYFARCKHYPFADTTGEGITNDIPRWDTLMLDASTTVHGYDLLHLPILNPGRCGGRTWVMELRGSAPIWVVVEAETVHDALLVLADDPDFGEAVYVAHVLDDDSPEDDSGRCLTTHRVRVYGEPDDDPPYPVVYHGIGFPPRGIDPRRLATAPFN